MDLNGMCNTFVLTCESIRDKQFLKDLPQLPASYVGNVALKAIAVAFVVATVFALLTESLIVGGCFGLIAGFFTFAEGTTFSLNNINVNNVIQLVGNALSEGLNQNRRFNTATWLGQHIQDILS